MLHHRRRVLHRRDDYPILSGSIVATDSSPTGTVLVQNTAAPTSDNIALTGASILTSGLTMSPTTAAVTSSVPSTTASSTPSSSDQISLGTVIGACVAALFALLFSVLLAFYCSRRHQQLIANANARFATKKSPRRRSHPETWKRMDDVSDRWERRDRSSMKQRPTSGPLGAMFRRTNSNTSGEDGHSQVSVGTMQNFAKYHPGLAAEMASQSALVDADAPIAKPPPVLHLTNRGSEATPRISWDGETVRGESYSLHSSTHSKPPVMIATEKSTPLAMTSSLHRWESAEVLHVSQIGSDFSFSDSSGIQNPFSNRSSSVKSGTRGQNPFFSAQDHHPVKRTVLPDTQENPFADHNTPRDSADAIQSLIAALEAPPPDRFSGRISSMQSSVYSRRTGDDGESAISVTAFPYPPTR